MKREEMDALDQRIKDAVLAQAETLPMATMCCMPVGEGEAYFDDDLFTECARCKVLVRYRPYIPDHWEKLCIDCVGAALLEEELET